MKSLYRIYSEKGRYLGEWYGASSSDAVVQARISQAQANFNRAFSAKRA